MERACGSAAGALVLRDDPARFFSLTVSPHEVSLVLEACDLRLFEPSLVEVVHGRWCALNVCEGEFGFTGTAVVQKVTSPLADAGITVFYVSTMHTDYVLVEQRQLLRALLCLKRTFVTRIEGLEELPWIPKSLPSPLLQALDDEAAAEAVAMPPLLLGSQAAPAPESATLESASTAHTPRSFDATSAEASASPAPAEAQPATAAVRDARAPTLPFRTLNVLPMHARLAGLATSTLPLHTHALLRLFFGHWMLRDRHWPTAVLHPPTPSATRHGSAAVQSTASPTEPGVGGAWEESKSDPSRAAMGGNSGGSGGRSGHTLGVEPIFLSCTIADGDVSLLYQERPETQWFTEYLDGREGVVLLPTEWRPIQVAQPLDMVVTGIVSAQSAPLQEAGLAMVYLSTFSTDFTFVHVTDEETAVRVLSAQFEVIQGVTVVFPEALSGEEEEEEETDGWKGLPRSHSSPRVRGSPRGSPLGGAT